MISEEQLVVPDILKDWIMIHYGVEIFNEFEKLSVDHYHTSSLSMGWFSTEPQFWVGNAFDWFNAPLLTWTTLTGMNWYNINMEWVLYLGSL